MEDVQRLVEQVQSSIEQDAEAVRIVSYDLARIIERQTLNYYKARNGRAQRRGVRRDMP